MRPALALVAVVAAALAASPAAASIGRVAVGVAPGASYDETVALVEQATGSVADRSLEPIGAFVVEVESAAVVAPALAAVPGVEYAEEQTAERRLVFQPNDPLAATEVQWYLGAIRAFDWTAAVPAGIAPVRVAVVDSGVDGSHPELQGQVVAWKSFVPGRADVDRIGHGTRVAGEIAALTNNGEGIAGVGLSAKLVVAKVVAPDGTISAEAEAKAIQWAVEQGARVINLSLGGSEYSRVEQAAVAYAYGSGAVVVAATGNTEPPKRCPSSKASYPARLPHVLGVGAVGADGTVPCWSNRDGRYNDLIAPGVGIGSTIPLALSNPGCGQPGYSVCNGQGTSYAAPLVAGAAAVAFSLRGDLAPSQVEQILQMSTAGRPARGRNATVGNGLLDVTRAVERLISGPLPPADAAEPNDDAGQDAAILTGSRPRVDATIDWYDDPTDVYRVYVPAGGRIVARAAGLESTGTLVLWPPGTASVSPVTQVAVRSGRIVAYTQARTPVLRVRVPRAGWYFVELKIGRKAPYQRYRLTIEKR